MARNPATCHPDRFNWGRGLCKQCYMVMKYWEDPKRYRGYQKKYREADKEKFLAREKAFREKPENRARACIRSKEYKAAHPVETRARAKLWISKNRLRIMFSDARDRARKREIPFDLVYEDLVMPKYCPVLGIELRHAKGKPNDNSPTIDRIDSTKGYTRNNHQIISWKANRLKNSATLAESWLITNYVLDHIDVPVVDSTEFRSCVEKADTTWLEEIG